MTTKKLSSELKSAAMSAAEGAIDGAIGAAVGVADSVKSVTKGAKSVAAAAKSAAVSAASTVTESAKNKAHDIRYGAVREGDTRIGATQESLDELMANLTKAKEAARLAPPGDEYTKIAEFFAMPVMQGDAKMMLDLPEEAKNEIFRLVGEGFLTSFANATVKGFELDWLKDAAKEAMAGMVRGIFALDDEMKDVVLEEQARVCFLDHLKHIKAWDKFGITSEPGSYTPDGAVAFLGNMLSLREVQRTRDTIFWRGNTRQAYRDCCCVIFRAGIIDEQLPEYCQCAVKLMKYQFEYLTGQPMEAAMFESLNCTGADTCEFRVHIRPSLEYAEHYEHTRS